MSKVVYKKALKTWGQKAQIEMALEESIELSLAIRKYLRNPCDKTYNDLAGEIADLEIMIDQLKYMFIDLQPKVGLIKLSKIERLKSRLELKVFES